MRETLETVKNMVEMGLFHQPKKTEDELRSFIRDVASAIPPGLDDEEIEQIAREIEFNQGIKAGLGAVVDSEDFEPWLDDAKSSIDPFYWSRYQKLLLQSGLPKDVVIATDQVTDTVLSRLGNPRLENQWDRRGMVVGHVQSGKTANYTGLICKAADAGYRLIIVIAGIHNNLRNQTQERIDDGLIGSAGGCMHGASVTAFIREHCPEDRISSSRSIVRRSSSMAVSGMDMIALCSSGRRRGRISGGRRSREIVSATPEQ